MKHETCNKRTPSREVTVKDCRRFYGEALENPKNESLYVCAQCERGKALYFGKKKVGTDLAYSGHEVQRRGCYGADQGKADGYVWKYIAVIGGCL